MGLFTSKRGLCEKESSYFGTGKCGRRFAATGRRSQLAALRDVALRPSQLDKVSYLAYLHSTVVCRPAGAADEAIR